MSFFGSFFGSDQRKDLAQGKASAEQHLGQYYNQGRQDVQDYAGRATGYMQPWVQTGQAANKLWGDATGANGADAQKSYYAGFQNDPGWQAQFQAGMNALDKSAASRGGLYSGAAMKGVANYGQQFQRQAFQDRLGQLAAQSGSGQGAAGTMAGLTANTGNVLGNMAQGYGQNLAGNDISYANALAASRNTGIQNMLGLGGMLIGGFTGGAGGMSPFGRMGNALMGGANSFSGGNMGFPTSGGWSTNPNAWAAR